MSLLLNLFYTSWAARWFVKFSGRSWMSCAAKNCCGTPTRTLERNYFSLERLPFCRKSLTFSHLQTESYIFAIFLTRLEIAPVRGILATTKLPRSMCAFQFAPIFTLHLKRLTMTSQLVTYICGLPTDSLWLTSSQNTSAPASLWSVAEVTR